MTALTYAQVMEKLPGVIAECLGLDEVEVTPDLVFDDDSIGIFDLNFRCEKAFGIKSPFRLFVGSKGHLSLDGEGFLTDDSIQYIRDHYAFFAACMAAQGQTRWRPYEMLACCTVEVIAQFIVQAAAEQAASSQAA